MTLQRMLAFLSLFVSTALLTSACAPDPDDVPRAYGRLVLGEEERCPSVAGRYFDSSEPITAMLVTAATNRGMGEADIAWFEITPKGDSTLLVELMYRDSTSVRGQLKRAGQYAGDYFCENGWLKVGDHRIPQTWDAEMKSGDFFPRRHQFQVAPNRDGALVARLLFIDYEQFDVWCGDGCKGFPIPGTFEFKEQWSIAEAYDPDLPPPVARKREQERQRLVAEYEEAKKDRIFQENELLENGPPDPELETVRRRALLSLPDGVLLRGVGRNGNGFHLSVEFEEMYQLEQFMERVSGSGPVAEIRIAPLYRAKTTQGRWTDVVFVRYDK
jgi:hypothetical protein